LSQLHQNRRVLIVDDSYEMRCVVRMALRKLDVEVTEAENAERAMELLLSEAFALVITDYEMPGSTGVELIRSILADPKTATPVLILLTAHDLEKTAPIRALKSEITTSGYPVHFAVKDGNLNALKTVLSIALRQHSKQ